MSRRERGVALIIAVVSITLLTVVATEFAYNSRVDMQLAANHRDETRAYYLARSGINLSRLLLSFQKQVNNIQLPPGLGDMLGALTGGGAAPGAGGAPLPTPSSLNIQLWKMARVDCHMLQGMVQSDVDSRDAPSEPSGKFAFDEEFPELAGEMQRKSFGAFQGCFLAEIGDEEQKLNLHRLDSGGEDATGTIQALMSLMGDKRFEFLWQKEDANGVRTKPEDVILALKNWMDADEVGDALDTSGQGTSPFVRGFSDENGEYQRFEPRYSAKNARFDTVDELYRVHGVNDRFMAAFGDRLTVYPDANKNLNINSDDPMLMYASVLSVLHPTSPNGRHSPLLQNPLFVEELIQRIRTARMFSFFGMSVQDFLAVVQSAGLEVNPSITANVAGNRLVSDKSETFSIKSVGEAGDVQKTITTVIRIGQQDGPLGRLVYWREE